MYIIIMCVYVYAYTSLSEQGFALYKYLNYY